MMVNVIDCSKITVMTMHFILPTAPIKKDCLGGQASYARSERGREARLELESWILQIHVSLTSSSRGFR